jgi:hypothetical protein
LSETTTQAPYLLSFRSVFVNIAPPASLMQALHPRSESIAELFNMLAFEWFMNCFEQAFALNV